MLTPFWILHADAQVSNRLAWRVAALLAATMALTAAALYHGKHGAVAKSAPAASPPPLLAGSPPPSGTTVEGQSVTDCQRRIDFCARHVTAERSFVVFANGTCVIINEPAADPIQSAIELLKKCSGPDARFITRKIEADSYMVTYREPIFHCLFADEVAQLAPVVELSYAHFLAPSERQSQPDGWEPPFDAKLGLMARTFLNADAEDQRVAKVIRARPVPGTGASAAQASNTP